MKIGLVLNQFFGFNSIAQNFKVNQNLKVGYETLHGGNRI